MPGSTRARSSEIQAAAMQIVASVGITALDALAADARRVVLVGLCKQLQAQTDCAWDTARRHIAKAARRQRHPDWSPPDGWGGDRTMQAQGFRVQGQAIGLRHVAELL